MTRRGNPLSFEPSPRRRGWREEVEIGAHARRRRRRRILIGAFGAVLIAGAFVLYHQLLPRSAGAGAEGYPVRVRCASCGHTETVRVPFTQTFPMECPACGEMACQVIWRCRDCGAEFVREHTGPVVRCPECNSERVGSDAVP